VARAAARGESDPDMPSEFPERWSRFLPPEDVTARLRTQVRPTHAKNGQGTGEGQPPAGK
jgi:membrane protein